MRENNVAVVIVTYNRKELLRECLEHLRSQTYKTFDVIIVDNGSTDGTGQFVETTEALYYRLETNRGGAGGFNYGIKMAYEAGYQYMWIMDDDTMPKPDALRTLMDEAEAKPKFGFLASRVEWTDGKLCIMNRPVKKKPPREPWYTREKAVSEAEEGDVSLSKASFVSILIRRGAVKKAGLPIKEYFIWGDDMEYTQRISKHFKCYYVQDSVVVHKMKSNVGSNVATDEPERISRYVYAFRNDCCTARRNGFVPFLRYIKLVIWSIFEILIHGRDNRFKRIGAVMRGMTEGLTFNPKYEKV